MGAIENGARRGEFPVYVRITFGVVSLCATYLALRGLRLDALWAKMMAVEANWFAASVFIIMAASFLAFVTIRKRIFRNPLVSASLGGFMGFLTGAIASAVAGHVREGVFFRLTSLLTHPLDQAVAVFMTATWLLGIMAFLTLHLIWVLAVKVCPVKHSAL